jgi:hypothetical protein
MDEHAISEMVIEMKKQIYAHASDEIAFAIFSSRLESFVSIVQETHVSMHMSSSVYTSISSFSEMAAETKKVTAVEYKIADMKSASDCSAIISKFEK